MHLPALLCVFPQDSVYYVTRDASSPLLGALCFFFALDGLLFPGLWRTDIKAPVFVVGHSMGGLDTRHVGATGFVGFAESSRAPSAFPEDRGDRA